MLRVSEGTRSLAWSLAILGCVVCFGGKAYAMGVVIKPGFDPRGRRIAPKPVVTKEQEEQANKLVDEHMAGGGEAPSDAEKKKIAELIKGLGSDDYATREASSREVIKYGAKALKQLKAARKDKDLEVVQRAEEAIKKIESTGGSPAIAALRKIRHAAIEVIGERKAKWQKLSYTAELQSIALKAQGKKQEAEKKLEEKKKAGVRVAKLTTLLRLVGGVHHGKPIHLLPVIRPGGPGVIRILPMKGIEGRGAKAAVIKKAKAAK